MDASKVSEIVNFLNEHPEAIFEPAFASLKTWCERNGHAKFSPKSPNSKKAPHSDPFEINPDEDPDPERWPEAAEDDYQEVSSKTNSEDEAQLDAAAEMKSQAADLSEAGKLDEAIKVMTKALSTKPESAMWWAFRADLYSKKKFAKSALKDANKALEINPESARALRVKGTALRHLGKWEEAADALNHSNQVDYNEEIVALSKMCTERANKIRQTRWRKEQEKREQEELDRLRAEARAKAAAQHQQQQQEEEEASSSAPQPPRGGGGGGMPGGMPPGMADILNDPEVAELMQDPEVAAKMQTLMSNPMAAMQYMGDPKIGPLLQKLMGKMMGGGMGGMPGGMGGMPGGMGGMGGMPGGMGGMGGMPGGMGGMGGGKMPSRPPQQSQQAPPPPAGPKPGDDLD